MNWKRNGLTYILVLIAGVAFFSFLMPNLNEPKQVSLGKVKEMSQNNELRKLLIDGDQLLITTRDGTELRTNIPNMNYVDLQELGLDLKGVDYSIKSSGVNWGQIALNFLPLILFGGLLFFLFRRSAKTPQ
ncbi:MAG: hypothetical protein HYX79_05240 [Chloroflexi bacterium]|nr:hypothetical protein [Chloroflexota bacterium]